MATCLFASSLFTFCCQMHNLLFLNNARWSLLVSKFRFLSGFACALLWAVARIWLCVEVILISYIRAVTSANTKEGEGQPSSSCGVCLPTWRSLSLRSDTCVANMNQMNATDSAHRDSVAVSVNPSFCWESWGWCKPNSSAVFVTAKIRDFSIYHVVFF